MQAFARLRSATLAAALAAFAYPAKETLHLQIGKDQDLPDTVLLWIDDERPPEVERHQGVAWSGMEKDSVWIDEESVKRVRYTHNILARMGERRGYGFVHLAPGAVLRAPPGARALKVFDVRGRLHWEALGLAEGAQVAVPGGLPQGALRYRWQYGPG